MGSHNTDTSYNFDEDYSIDNNVNANDKTPETTNSKYSVMSRVGAKVRRLDLSGDVKQKQQRKGDDSTAASSPKRVNNDATMKRMYPTSTTRKKGAISRVMLSRGIVSMDKETENDDVSPRDAADFPFFESPNKCEGVKVMNADNESMACSGVVAAGFHPNSYDVGDVAKPISRPPPTARKNNHHERQASLSSSPTRTLKSYGRADSFLQMFSQEEPMMPHDMNDMMNSSPSPPKKCPPTTSKKSHPRRRDLSPPQSLRAHGRANSFLQMFSQESLLKDEDDANMTDNDDLMYSLKSPNELQIQKSSPINQHPSPPQRSSSFSRFVADFEVVGTLGNGSFGSVYKVRNRMDKRMYAIKAAKREARGPSDREHMLQEVYALAALSDDTTAAAMHIVGYHQAWMEGSRLYIQTELCDGSLEKEIGDGSLDEKRRYKVLREMSLALDLVHKSGMIHLDIKVSRNNSGGIYLPL